jgi:hypothetical protein
MRVLAVFVALGSAIVAVAMAAATLGAVTRPGAALRWRLGVLPGVALAAHLLAVYLLLTCGFFPTV